MLKFMSRLNVVGDAGNFVVFFATLEGFHHAWTQAAAEHSNDVFTTNSMPHFFTFVSEQLIKFIQRYGTGFEFRSSVFCGINGIYAPYKVCGGSQLLSKVLNASNGLLVNTPPKSQRMALISLLLRCWHRKSLLMNLQ